MNVSLLRVQGDCGGFTPAAQRAVNSELAGSVPHKYTDGNRTLNSRSQTHLHTAVHVRRLPYRHCCKTLGEASAHHRGLGVPQNRSGWTPNRLADEEPPRFFRLKAEASSPAEMVLRNCQQVEVQWTLLHPSMTKCPFSSSPKCNVTNSLDLVIHYALVSARKVSKAAV